MKTLYKDAAGKYYEKDANCDGDILYIELYDVSKEYSLPLGCVFHEYGVGGWSTDKTFVSELKSTKEKVKEILVEYDCVSERLYVNVSQLEHFLTEVFLCNKQDLKTLIKLSKRYGYILNAL